MSIERCKTIIVAAVVLVTVNTTSAYSQTQSEKINAANASINDYQSATSKHAAAIKTQSTGIAVPKQFYDLAVKIDKATGTIEAAKEKAIDFKNADTITKINMRCDSPLLGMKAAAQKLNLDLTKYYQTREYVCQLAVYAAKLQQMYEDYQRIKTEGLPLFQKHKKETLHFPSNRKRTTQLWVDLRYMPDDKAVKYGVWFQWSDDKQVQLIPPPISSNDDAKKGICIPLSTRAKFCFKVLSTTTTSAKVDLWADVRAYDRNKQIGFGAVVIPAPFGYLDQLNQMKEQAKQNAVNDIKKRVADLAGIDAQTQQKIQTLAGLAAKINQ